MDEGVVVGSDPQWGAFPIHASPGHDGELWIFALPWLWEELSFELTCTGTSGSRSDVATLDVHMPLDHEFTPITMDLPIVTITSDADIQPPDGDYVTGHISIDANGNDSCPAFAETEMEIRGRGNSSWTLATKKSFKIKFDSKRSLCGLPGDKEWALLANFADKTLLRNAVAMELSNRFGLAYTPRVRPVEVFLSGSYNGTYLLIETIKRSVDRVNITKLDPDDITPETITGGYLLEWDDREDGDIIIRTPQTHLPIVLQDPDDPDETPDEQETYIVNYIADTENAILGPNFADPDIGYAAYIDADSFINWYLVNEIFSNIDSYFYSSCWMYKDRGAKLKMGPVWDFDLGAGNIDYQPPAEDPEAGWWTRTGPPERPQPWLGRLFEDPAFEARVRARWNEMKDSGQIDSILTYIDQRAAVLNQAQQNNFRRWPILDRYVWPNRVIRGTYQGEVDELKDWLHRRIVWMDTQFNPQPE